MDLYNQKSRWKWWLGIAGAIIVLITLIFTKYITDKLAEQERKNVKVLVEATSRLNVSQEQMMQANAVVDPTTGNEVVPQEDFSFFLQIINNNDNIPVLVVGQDGLPQDGRNFGVENDTSLVFLKNKLAEFQAAGKEPLPIQGFGTINYLYFDESYMLKLLKYYPYLQLALIGAFITMGYIAFSSARRGEQNRVWAGMAKETAHQLGTPISGIIGWIEHLRVIREDDEEIIEVAEELRNDVNRLELVADRFSKIGSDPELTEKNIIEELTITYEYMKRRAPRKVSFEFPDAAAPPIMVKINAHLFNWVIENLLRNALDAMGREGKIKVSVAEMSDYVNIELSDTGKGIPSNKHKTVFQPGYSTKKRGWGLGLSLAKRIIEEYHSGKICVKKSVENQGTTFAIQLPRQT